MTNTFSRDPKPRVQYTGDGARTTFPFPFPVLQADDLLVWLDDEAATGFAVTGLGQENGGSITFATPPAAGRMVTLLRRTESIRETDFVDGTPFRAAAINAALDRVMLLVQEDRDEHRRALRAQPMESGTDFCLPPTAERASKLLGFDSAGAPATFGLTEVPDGGEASGLTVMPIGASTARALGEHLGAVANVRDFGALGDGITDDAAAFQAAIAAAQARRVPVHVPAGPNAYVVGAPLVLDGVAMRGEGAGSTIALGIASGAGIELAGSGARLDDLRLIGPAANAWPTEAGDVDFTGVALDGVRIAPAGENAALAGVEVAGCFTGVAVEGHATSITGCDVRFNRTGIDLRAGAEGAALVSDGRFEACSSAIHAASGTAARLVVRGGSISATGTGVDLDAPATGWRAVEVEGVGFESNLEADVRSGPRHTLGLRSCALGTGGRRAGAAVDLVANGETDEAPSLFAEGNTAQAPDVATVQLSGGSNLNLLQPGDLVVLSGDADDVDDLWTCLKAARAGVVHAVTTQTTGTAQIELATAAGRPLIQAGDVVRVVGRSGTASVDSVGTSAPAATFTWLATEDHCRVFAAHNPMPKDAIALGGSEAALVHVAGQGSGGFDLDQMPLNGGFVRFLSFEIDQDAAVSFTPDSPVGMVQAFSNGDLGDPIAAIFSYRAEGLGFTELLANGTTSSSVVEVAQLTPLNGTSGNPGSFTFSAHSDGRIYLENRTIGTRTVGLFVVGASF